jgi:hypothetical protein
MLNSMGFVESPPGQITFLNVPFLPVSLPGSP